MQSIICILSPLTFHSLFTSIYSSFEIWNACTMHSSKYILLLKSLAYSFFYRTISLKGLSALCITYKRNKLNGWTISHFSFVGTMKSKYVYRQFDIRIKREIKLILLYSTIQLNGRVGCMDSSRFVMHKMRKNSDWKLYNIIENFRQRSAIL